MKLITKRSLIREVAKCWRAQYQCYMSTERIAIAEKLDALNVETATAEEVAKIIGNNSWCSLPPCEECEDQVAAIVSLGLPEGDHFYICPTCLKKALALIYNEEC